MLEVTKVIRIRAIRYARYAFLLVFHYNYLSSFCRFRDIVTYFPKLNEVM